MMSPINDTRSREDILEEIKTLARSYTPEWKPDFDDPDAGAALAEIFAEAHYGTIRRFDRLPEVCREAFCGFIGTELRPAEPSSGYVRFGASSEAEGRRIDVPAGTVLTASSETYGFTTLDDVHVTCAEILHIFRTDERSGSILKVYTKTEDSPHACFTLFSDISENLNSHTAWLGMKNMPVLGSKNKLEIAFFGTSSELFAKKLNDAAEISVYSEDGWKSPGDIFVENDTLIIRGSDNFPIPEKYEINGRSGFWIRISADNTEELSSFAPQRIGYKLSGKRIAPDVMLTKLGELPEADGFYSFGEEPSVYDCFYIKFDEVFGRRGAMVGVEITVEYPPMNEPETVLKPLGDWKPLMKSSDLREEKTAVSEIVSVVWEYFNGAGWKALPCSPEAGRIFCPFEGKRLHKLEFVCPDDITSALVGAEEGYFIRARISRMKREFLPNIIFRAPAVRGVELCYCYTEYRDFDLAYSENNMEFKRHDARAPISIFESVPQLGTAMYFGLSRPLDESVRILAVTEKHFDHDMFELQWEYYSANGWKRLRLTDETKQFAQTGFLNIGRNKGFVRKTLFKESCYWIRARSVDKDPEKNGLQRVSFFDFNCTEVSNIQKEPDEFFGNKVPKAGTECRLSKGNICGAKVWVNENSLHGAEYASALCDEELAKAEYDEFGAIRRLWVKWRRAERLSDCGANDRAYSLDPNTGVITFGDGIHGMIPCTGSGDMIRVEYSVGGGSSGNVGAGEIHGSREALGFVTKIGNPFAASGGNDAESIMAAPDRVAAELNSGGRCVTAADYEQMALYTERSILKVKCVFGERGDMTLAIMREDLTREGVHFRRIREKLLSELGKVRAECLSGNKLRIIHPTYIYMCVSAKVAVDGAHKAYRVKERLVGEISAFLHPITGNFDGRGWQIGVLPSAIRIENMIRSIEGISDVKGIMLRGFLRSERGMRETDLNTASAESSFYIAVSGEHDIDTV